MKKNWWKISLCLALATLLLACTALAAIADTDVAAVDNVDITVLSDGKLKVTVPSTMATVDGQYVVMVVKIDKDNVTVADNADGNTLLTAVQAAVDHGKQPYAEIDENTILYIDQKKATTDGVVFADEAGTGGFLPKSITDAVIILGGGEGDPVILGVIKGHGVTVSGQVKSYRPKDATTIQLFASANTTYQDEDALYSVTVSASSQTDNNEATQDFSITGVETGKTYTLVVKKPGNLNYIIKGIAVETDDLDLTSATGKPYALIRLISGNMAADTGVNSGDLTVFRNNYNRSGSDITDALADIDGSNAVNSGDLTIFRNSYNKTVSNCTDTYGA